MIFKGIGKDSARILIDYNGFRKDLEFLIDVPIIWKGFHQFPEESARIWQGNWLMLNRFSIRFKKNVIASQRSFKGFGKDFNWFQTISQGFWEVFNWFLNDLERLSLISRGIWNNLARTLIDFEWFYIGFRKNAIASQKSCKGFGKEFH